MTGAIKLEDRCPYCEKCNHTGRIPFKNKEGKLIPHVYLHCDCHPIYGIDPEPERYQEVSPEDFDFPCSYSWRAYYQETFFNEHLPALEISHQDILPIIPPEHKLYDRLQQAEGKLINLQNKINEHLDKKKKDIL